MELQIWLLGISAEFRIRSVYNMELRMAVHHIANSTIDEQKTTIVARKNNFNLFLVLL